MLFNLFASFIHLSPENGAYVRLFAYVLFGFIVSIPVQAQMLFTENLTMNIDSAKTIQGSLQPVLNFKTEKENVLTFKNTANLNLLIGKNRVVNLINKLEFSAYGKKVTVSGGHVHAEFRYLLAHAFEVYPYAESQWAGSRGMNFKVSAGLQSRYRLVNTDHFLMFATAGFFYEFEKWEYPDPPVGTPLHAYSRYIKSHLSLSFKHTIGEHWEFIATGIHQARPDSLTPGVGFRGTYRIIYDTAPIVPIRKDYNVVEAGIDISF